MTDFANRAPGMPDCYPSEAKRRRSIESQLLSAFERAECELVTCGTFEYVDTLLRARPFGEASNWVRLFDPSGNALALRPDITPSIARMAAPVLAKSTATLRWCYAERVYRHPSDMASLSSGSGKTAESTQVGVEWLGFQGYMQDAKLIVLCRHALAEVGVKNAQIVISHAKFPHLVMKALQIAEHEIDNLLHLLTDGNFVDFRSELLRQGVAVDVLRILQSLNPYEPESFNILQDVAPKSALDVELAADWQYLTALANTLQAQTLQEMALFDFTLHRDIHYYTGVVFEGFAAGVGAPIVLGGRYDELLAQFGSPSPAIGFVFDLERVLTAISHSQVRKHAGGGAP